MIKTNLKELLEKNNLSINKLSIETGLSRPTLTSLLNNDSKGIQFDTLETLLDFFNIPISDFFTVTDREILFYFREVVDFENLEMLENSTPHNSQNVDGSVNIKPSKAFLYNCQIVDHQNETNPFSLVVSPVEQGEKLLLINLAFFRANPSNETEDTSDINKFLSKLNNEAIVNLIQNVLTNWLKYYTKVKEFNLFLNSMVFVEIIVFGFKTRIPAVVNIHKEGTTIKLSFETYIQNSPRVGDDVFSSKLSFINNKVVDS